MRKTTGFGAVVVLQLGLHACTPSTNVPGTDLYIEAADGKYHGPMQALRIEPSNITLEVSVGQGFKAIGVFEDGTEVGITEKVYWEVTDEGVAAKGDAFDAGALPLTGMSVGQTQIKVIIGDLTASTTLDVIPAALISVAVSAAEGVPAVLRRSDSYQFRAVGTYRDAHVEDLTEQATWTSSDPAVLVPQETAGVVKAGVGQATLTAKVGDVEGTLTVDAECRYPDDAPQYIKDGAILPHLSWDNAQDQDGNVFRFDMEDAHCGAGDWADVKTLVFQVSAVWCGPCNARMPITARAAPDLMALGSRVFYVEAQNLQGGPIGTVAAAEHIDQIIGDGLGTRLGDRDSKPIANIFNTSPGFIEAFPTIFVVRTSDMKMIANSMNAASGDLDLRAIAEHPEWIWADPDNPVEEFQSSCEPGQDESYEPNDTIAQAPELGATVVEGGICTDAPDFYRINIEGNWRVTLLFQQEIADLDVWVWNANTDAPLVSGGRQVGGFTTTNNESFEYHGKQLIKIQGKRNGSAPYKLFIEAL
jgi:hypothetical protein